jgi:hypothetical protein
VRDVVTPDTSKPSAEEEPKNVQVREVQKWMTNAVGQTIFEHINYPILEEAVKRSLLTGLLVGIGTRLTWEKKAHFRPSKMWSWELRNQSGGWNPLRLCRRCFRNKL